MRKIDKYKSRRNIALVASLVLLVASLMLFCVCSCGHEHEWKIAEVVGATCENGSYDYCTCECGESYKSEERNDKLGHDFYGDICQRCGYEREHVHTFEHRVIEPTCTSDGYDEYICSACLEVKAGTEKKPALGHRYIKDECEKCGDIREHVHDYKGEFHEPTCVAEGYLISTCFCGDIKIGTDRVPATGHNFVDDVCSVCGVKGEHIHKFTSRVVEAKCDVDGYTMLECQCGYSYKGEEVFVKLGHNYLDDVCSRCGVSRDHEHNYVPKTTHPTCTINGYVTYECRCGSNYLGDETIGALGHDFVNESCTRCGTKAPHQHNYISYMVDASCEVNGYIFFKCSCGDEYENEIIPMTGHKFVNDECTVCGQRRDHIHTYTTKVVNAKCEEAGYILFECKCGHSYKGNEALPALGHSYINGVCERCGSENHVHNFVPVVVDAKCLEDGYIFFVCQCGEKQGDNIPINKLGHDFVNDKCTRCGLGRDHVHDIKETVVPPTCEKDGYTAYECQSEQCDYNEQDNFVPKLGHHYENDKCIRCDKVRVPVKISSATISINGQSVEKYQVDIGVNNIPLNVIINLGESLDNYIAPEITWSIVGDGYGSTVDEYGELILADFIGEITVRVVIKGENEVTVDLPVTVKLPENTEFEYISATVNEGFVQEYIEGESFNASSIKLWGELNGKNIQITEFTWENKSLTPDVTDVKIYYSGLVTEVPVIVKHNKVLKNIVIISAPTKTKYLEGEKFEKNGLKINAIYDNKEEEIFDFFVDTNKELSVSDKAVAISYTHNGITKKAEQKIEVYARKLLSISVDETNVRKLYTQGDVFDRSGLIVTATYEGYGSKEVVNYYYSQEPLKASNKTVKIYFTDGDYTKAYEIIVRVEKPYTQISHVKVMSPKDVSIIWSYSYMTDNGEMIIDNTAYAKNNLKYDKLNGEYEIPMGAVVTATIKNPSVINLSLNDYEQSISYQEKTTSWIMGDADLVLIKSINASGSYSIIRFEGSENDKTFMFGDEWDGYLAEEELVRIEAIFADTENYYYTYLINGEMKGFSDLASIQFKLNSNITVLKNAISSNAKELCLYVDGDQVYSIFVTDEVLLSELPKFTKEGYDSLGYALTPGGDQITQEDLTALITGESNEYKLYTRFIKPEIDYSDEFIENGQPTFGTSGTQFVGSWATSGSGYNNNGAIIEYESVVTFNADGTFTYKVTTKEQKVERIFEYYGEYRIEGNTIKVLSVSTNRNDIVLISPYDLGFTLEAGKIKAYVVVFTLDNLYGYEVIDVILEKQ